MIILQKYYVQGQGVEACQLVADDGSALADDKDFLLLLAGLGGGSDDSYVRSMGAAAHASGRWQVAL
jgi:predicted alpha/beta-fold hydrolase